MKRRKIQISMTLLLAAATLIAGCSLDGTGDGTGAGTGTMNLSMTDAPIDAEGVNGVFITVEGIEYNLNGDWETMADFEGPQTFNLAALTNGESKLLGALQLPAGDYTQIRFMIGAKEQGSPASGTAGSWVEYGDAEDGTYDADTDKALFIPSGGQTGYKAQAGEPFTVPSNGSVDITADFDLRKAVIETPNFMLLKPVLRLVVDNQAGSISGEVTYTGENDVVVYAYEAGTYEAAEAADPTIDDDSRFPNAVTSGRVVPVSDTDTTLMYTLAYLAADTNYDLVVAEYTSEGTYAPDSATTIATDLDVEADDSLSQDLDLTQ